MDGMNNMPNNQQMSNNQQMQYNQQMPNYQQMPGGMMPKGPNNSGKIIALILGIVSISVGFLGGILFGIFGALIGIACGVVGLLLSIHACKIANEKVVNAPFICSIVGTSLSALFFFGCLAYGSGTWKGYGCYGYVGERICACSEYKEYYDYYLDY